MEAEIEPRTTIVTLQLDERSQAFFERLRREHFPPERNLIGAHLTLFHTLPDTNEVRAALRGVANSHSVFAMKVTGLRSLGRGVAYTLEEPYLERMHLELAEKLWEHLSAQDRQKVRAHVVVQNKTTPENSRALLAKLERKFEPFSAWGLGLQLWRYLGGPWELLDTFPFIETPALTTGWQSGVR